MSSKRGLSLEEKRKRMLEFFHETQDFYQLKDVEKTCSTEKGITLNTIEEVLKSLADDGLVTSSKIGTSTYYWSLPSETLKKRQEKLDKTQSDLKREEERNKIFKDKLAKFSAEQEKEGDNSEKRNELSEKINILTKQKEKFQKELEAFKENDPEAIKEMRKNIEMSKKACNRWVDNIFSLKSWLKNKFRFDESMIDKQFEIPSDLDYFE